MEVEVKLPKLGTTMKSAFIDQWLKAEGDSVVQGEDLIEITTDKVEAVVQAPASGTLVHIIVEKGQEADVGAVLGVLEEES